MRTVIPSSIALWILLSPAAALSTGLETCPPPGTSRQSLAELKRQGFELEDDGERDRLAVALLGCVGDPDPELRDGVAFEAISHWLRARAVAPDTLRALAAGLTAQLAEGDDPAGFRRPFAALILSEVVRADRIDPALDDAARREIAQLAARYLRGVGDYRGFDEREGWRHGVAHGADLVLQLAVHPRTSKEELDELMAAIATQVAPAGEVFYVYGEPERLARAVFYAHRRGLLSAERWAAFFEAVSDPRPLESWSAAFRSQEGLAKRHNTLGFLRATFFAGHAGDDEAGAALAGLARQAIGRVYGG